jgi:hypothetical protein
LVGLTIFKRSSNILFCPPDQATQGLDRIFSL